MSSAVADIFIRNFSSVFCMEMAEGAMLLMYAYDEREVTTMPFK